MADDRSIEDILCSIQHHDQGIRRSGEILYHQFQSSINYVDIVIKFSSDAAKPAHCRHLAIVLLNQQIAKDWNSFPQNSKSALVQFSFDRCSDQIAAIRTACMLMLSICSRIAAPPLREAWLEHTPSLGKNARKRCCAAAQARVCAIQGKKCCFVLS